MWVELAGFDSGMLSELIERRIRPGEWRGFLEEYAGRGKWATAEFLEQNAVALRHPALWHASVSPQYEDAPPHSLFGLWAEGACDRVADRGVELHSALLAELGRDDLLEHRIWRAQVGALLPLIDQARLALARCLDVPLRDGGRAVEFTEIQTAAATGPDGRGSGELRALVSELHRTRNQLAHYQCLTWDEFQTVVAALLRLPRLLPRPDWDPRPADARTSP